MGAEQRMATRVIIDTDTGIDDGMGGIYGLLAPELEVAAVTTIFGNVEVEQVTRNTALILERLGATDVPLAEGAARAIGVSNFTAAHLAGLMEDAPGTTPAVNQIEVHPRN